MRIVFFLEPVVVQSNPLFLTAHFFWARAFQRAAHSIGGAFALAANPDVCESWRAGQAREFEEDAVFPIDPFKSLAPFGYRRSAYMKALYGDGDSGNPLVTRLREVSSVFGPDVVVATSQSSFVKRAFPGLPILHVEQAPLPRFGHAVRTAIDPCGHQAGSLLETQAARIRTLPLSRERNIEVASLAADMVARMVSGKPHALQACELLKEIRGNGHVALLVTQPPDWVTYEGAYQAQELEGLICNWASRLPAGWIGVPTYHPGFRLTESLEVALARSFPNLRFLPQSHSQGTTEPLLTVADGMVTLSSTSAITALLLRKPIVVAGVSPFSTWASSMPELLESCALLTETEVNSTLAFLCHRYSHLQSEWDDSPQKLAQLLESLCRHPDPKEWFLDLSEFDIRKARSLFVWS